LLALLGGATIVVVSRLMVNDIRRNISKRPDKSKSDSKKKKNTEFWLRKISVRNNLGE
jgi:hypothetical protein